MFIKSNRDELFKGFSIKDCNGNGIPHIYVWNKHTFDATKVKERRAKAKEKGKEYSKVGGWKDLGRLEDPSTMEKLKEHLRNIYGEDFIETEQDIVAYFREQHELKEQKRIKQVQVLWEELQTLAEEKGVVIKRIPQTINGLKKRLKQLKEQ